MPPGCCSSILRARWAAGTPHMPPRPGTTGTQRQHATWAAALLGRLPRLPSLARAAAAAAWPMWRSRASERACRGRSKFFFVGWWAARLEQEARSRVWLCPPRRHKHTSRPLPRLAAIRSARSLPPARVRMASARSAARGGVFRSRAVGRRNCVRYARFARPAVTAAIAVTPRNNLPLHVS